MATKRGEKSKHELVTLAQSRKADLYIERLVLPTDSLQGIALLYNTSVAELKKLNHIHKDADLHARRIVKVPSRGVLVDLTEEAAVPILPESHSDDVESDEESTNGQVYLSNVDSTLQELREKAENVAANSVVLQTSSNSDLSLTRKDLLDMKARNEDIAWWKIAIPCIGVLLIFPFLYYLYLEHLENIHHHLQTFHLNTSKSSHDH